MKLSTKLKIVALSLVAAFGAGLVYYANAETIDNTRDCDKYAVVYCGTMSVQEMRERYFNKGVSTIYGAFGISYEMLSGNYANGAVYRNGEVRLDNGTVVATNARTAIRNISGGTPISGTDAKVVPASRMGSAQRAFIRLDEQGRFKFAIMTPCGNPVVATNVVVPPKPKPQPVATCKALDQPVINRQTNTVALKAHATVENGATVKSYTFSITDASGKEVFSRSNTTSALTSETSATIKEAGTYTARVTVTTSLGDRTSNDCVKQFTIQPETPKANPGIKIEKKVDGVKHKTVQVGNEFPYQVTVTNTGNVDLKNAVVTDNAPQGVTFLKASEGTLRTIPGKQQLLNSSRVHQRPLPSRQPSKNKLPVKSSTPPALIPQRFLATKTAVTTQPSMYQKKSRPATSKLASSRKSKRAKRTRHHTPLI